jgi:tRNA threonylcarbamoyladenosine biosynthesis protein TsaE
MEVFSRSTDQTRRIGMRLGPLLRIGDVVCLEGELGTGKTTLVQGLAAGWGSFDPVSSPTFMLLNLYRRTGGEILYHLDAYRLNGPEEAIDLDIDNLLRNGSLVIEWADRIRSALPNDHLWVSLNWRLETQRDLLFTAHGKHYTTLLQQFKQQVYGGA